MWRISILYRSSYLLIQLASLKTHSFFAGLTMEELLCAKKLSEISNSPLLLTPFLCWTSRQPYQRTSLFSLTGFKSCSLIFLGYILPRYRPILMMRYQMGSENMAAPYCSWVKLHSTEYQGSQGAYFCSKTLLTKRKQTQMPVAKVSRLSILLI